MAIIKTITFALLVAFAVQASCAELDEVDILKVERGIVEDFEKAIQRLMEIFEGALSKVTQLIENITKAIAEEVKVIIGKIDQVLGNIFDKIKELEEQAIAAGKDITECTKENIPKLEAIRDNAKQAARACHENTLNKIGEAFQEAKDELPNIGEIAQRLLDEFKACDGLLCRVGVIAKVGTETAAASVKVAAVIAKTTGKLTLINAQGVSCLASASADAAKESRNLLKEIVECAKNK